MKKQYMLCVEFNNGQDAVKVPASRDEVAQQIRAWRKSGIKVMRDVSLTPVFPPEVELHGAVFYFPPAL